MKKRLTLLTILLGLSNAAVGQLAFAKDSYELGQEANKLETHAAHQASKAAAEESESSVAIDEGKKGTAAKHAKRAAQEQDIANRYEKKADKVEQKAAKKAVKESY